MDLPKPIVAYFQADRSRDADAVAACFTIDGVVQDERKRHEGHSAIRRWKAEASRTYSYRVEPHSIVTEGGRTIVTGTVAGDFPGSPIDLRYVFVLEGDSISGLEIAP